MTTASDLADELEGLAKSATPGPWASEPDAIVTLDPVELDMERRMIADLRYFTLPHVDGNAALIVALRNNLPAILSALRRVECHRCADIRQRTKEEAEALATLRDRGMKLSEVQDAKADAVRQALTGEA